MSTALKKQTVASFIVASICFSAASFFPPSQSIWLATTMFMIPLVMLIAISGIYAAESKAPMNTDDPNSIPPRAEDVQPLHVGETAPFLSLQDVKGNVS